MWPQFWPESQAGGGEGPGGGGGGYTWVDQQQRPGQPTRAFPPRPSHESGRAGPGTWAAWPGRCHLVNSGPARPSLTLS